MPGSEPLPAAVLEAYRLVGEAVDGLGADSFELPTRLAGWRVAELVAHLTGTIDAVARYLAEPAPAHPDLPLVEYYRRAAQDPAGVDARARGAAAAPAPELRRAFRQARDAAAGALAGAPLDRVVRSRVGALALADFLRTRCLEVSVHALDLAAATGAGAALHPPALRHAVALAADMLSARHPGRAVEVRIPPYAAVQCLPGPTHTRGTPPNVVETDPVTWLELACGRTAWPAALEAGRVHASGTRADLSGVLPVVA